jgi:CreA protein
VACYVSRAQTGGYSGAVGLAKDPSRFSVACRQIGTISFAKPLPKQEEVFKESVLHLQACAGGAHCRCQTQYPGVSDLFRQAGGRQPDNAVTAVPVSGQNIPQK